MTNKTQPTDADVDAFVASLEDTRKQADARSLIDLMREVTGAPPVLWGASIVGFGQYQYRSERGRGADWFVLGFSPRKQNLTLYLPGYVEQHKALLAQLGKHSVGKGCVYLKQLSDADPRVLRQLLESAAASVTP